MAKQQGKKENRGGARPNSGPPKQTLSQSQIKEMRDAAHARAKKEGRSIFDVLLDIVYGESTNTKDCLAASKLYLDKMMIAVKEGGETDKVLAPQIYLPQELPDTDEAPDYKVA